MAGPRGKADKGKGRKRKPAAAASTPAVPAPPPQLLAATTAPDQRVVGRPFPPGVSGNPKGRPKSSRNKLAESFIEALAKDFAENGSTAIEKVRTDEPGQYLRVIASIVPKHLETEDEDGNTVGVALITRNAITAIIERGRDE